MAFSYPTCQTLDFIKEFDMEYDPPKYLWIRLNEVKNLRVKLNFEDRNRALHKRSLRSQTLDYSGNPLQIDDLMEPVYIKTFFKVSQTVNLEMDPGINCLNYPNSKFLSYRECDESFLYKELTKDYNIVPFWMVSNLSEVSSPR